MRLVYVVAPAAIAACLGASQAAVAAPGNDAFAAAAPISGWTATVTGTNVGATRESGEPLHAGVSLQTGSVWWSWTPTTSGTARIDTFGSGFDTILAVYTGGSVSALTQVAADDNVYGLSQSEVSFAATAGTTYKIAVAGFNYQTGTITLGVNAPRPANDDFASAQSLATATGSLDATLERATGEAGEPAHWGGGPYHSIWYRWVGDVASPITFATRVTTGYMPAVVVYTGTSFADLARVAAGGNGATFTPAPGTTYWIALDSSTPDPFTLTWSRPGPSNDNFDTSNFALLRGASGHVDTNNYFATKQPGEPSHAGNGGGASIWYLWEPGASGRVRISTAGSGIDTLLAVYSGSSLAALTQVAANDDANGQTTSEVTFDETLGSNGNYWIAVDGKNGATGPVSLTWAAVEPANDNLADAAALSGTSGTTTVPLLGATVEPNEPHNTYDGPTVWWTWTPAASGVVSFDTAGSPGDSMLRVFRGSSMSGLVGVASDGDAAGGADGKVSFVFRAGTRYLIQGSDFDGGSITLGWRVTSTTAPPVPANDAFAASRSIGGEIGHVAGTVAGATNEQGEPDQRLGGDSVWYGWTAPATGWTYFTLPTTDGDWPAEVQVFRGAALGSLTLEDAGDEYGGAAVLAIAGRRYSIRVESANGNGAGFVLDWNRDQPSPPNDYYSAAQTLAGASGSVASTTYNATFEDGEPDHSWTESESVWYRWTAPADGTYRFGIDASSGVVDVFTGSSIRGLVRATESFGRPAIFSATAGVTYSIAVVGGPFHATLSWGLATSAVANDDFAAPTVLSGDHGTVSGTTDGATSEGGEPVATAAASVWFRFTAPATGTYAFDTVGSSFDTALGVYAGESPGSLTALAIGTTHAGVGLRAGTTVAIAIGSANGATGQYALNWKRSFTTPANDDFAAAQAIAGVAGSATATNVGATKESGEPNHAGQPGGASVWFSWTAPASGPFVFATSNPYLDTQLAVYTGSSVSALVQVAANDDADGLASRVVFDATAGTRYLIAVDGWFDDGTTRGVDSGTFDLLWGQRPPNDDFARAATLASSGGAASGTLGGATTEAGEPPADASVWYRLAPAASGVYRLDLSGSGGGLGIDVWTGSSVSTLSRVALFEGYGPPSLSFPANAGTTYWVRVTGEGGSFSLAWNRGGPVNDAFARADALSTILTNGAWSQPTTASGTNAGASKETGEPNHAGNAGGASVWWTWTAPLTGQASADTIGSDFDTLVGVYTGSSVDALTQVAADDDSGGGGTSRAVFSVAAGQTYRIAVDGKNGATGSIRLRVQPARPANDDFAAAQTLSGANGALSANNNGATRESGEPTIAGNPGGHSLWYRWTAPSSGTFVVDAVGDRFGALLGVYAGVSLTSLSELGSAAGWEYGGVSVRFGATAGSTYSFALDGDAYGAQTGQIQLSWRPDTTASSNDLFAGAQTLTGWSGTLDGTNEGATLEAGEPRIGAGQTQWFRWTAPADGAIAFEVDHPFDGVAVDPLLALYTGPSVGSLVRVSDAVTNVHQRVTGGTTYWLQLDSIEDGSTWSLSWRQLSPPANDDFANAATIAGDHGTLVGALSGATRELGEPAHGLRYVSPTVSVWYRWTAPASGRATLDLRPATIDDDPDGETATINVYTGTALASLNRVTGSEELWGHTVAGRSSFDAVAGRTYLIAVAIWPGHTSPSFRLNWALPPANDDFAAAQSIAGASGSVDGRNTGASKQPGEPDHSGNRGGASVWYRWTAPATGTVVFDTAGSIPDTLLAAYSGSSVDALTELARDDEAAGDDQARIVFDVTGGQTYSIAIDGFYGPYLLELYDDTDTGDLKLSWRMSPANDALAAAEVLSDRSGRVAGSTVGATKETGEPSHAGEAGGHSIWYSWTAGADGDVVADTSGSSFDTLLGVYTGAGYPLVQVAASDDADGLATSRVRFHATAGTTYRFAVDGKAGASGHVFLQWRLEGAPSNDDLAHALPLTGAKGSVLVDNTWATKETGEPAHAGVTGGASVWYSWVSPVDATVTFETDSYHAPDTALAVYTGTGYPLTQVAANDDRSATSRSSLVTFTAVAGQTYLVAVDTRGGVYSLFQLWWNRPPDNDDRFSPHELTGASGNFTQSNAWATTQLGEQPVAGNAGGASVWFRWTAPASGTVTFDTIGSAVDTLLALYPDDYYNWTQTAGDDDSAGGGASRLSFAVTAGQSYELSVDGKNGATGTVVLRWSLPVSAPANDAFAAATAISGTYASGSGTTLGAALETGEPAHGGAGHSVWYRWTAPASGTVLATASTASWDLWQTLDVYTGTSIGALTSVARGPAAEYETHAIFRAVAGTTYTFAIDTLAHYTGGLDAGSAGLTVWLSGASPANDDFASAAVISGDSGSVSGTSATATPQAGEPALGGGRTVWYRWTPSTGGRVTLTPTASGGSYYDFPRIAVYTGSSLGALAPVPLTRGIAQNWPQPAPAMFKVDAGVTYSIEVDGSDPEPGAPEAGPFTLQWSTLAGDYFSGPIRLTGAGGTVHATTTGATREAGEPTHAQNAGGHSLWFAWTPSVGGSVTVDTAGSSFDTLLAVYTGTSLGGLTQVAANDDAPGLATSSLTFDAVAGTTYRIAADGYSGATGDLTLDWATAGVSTDTTPPTVALSAPAAGAYVGGQVTVSAAASDDVAVAQVQFFADGVSLGVDTTAPYSVLWSTGSRADGAATITARATDTAGNSTTSQARSVTVDNTAPAATITSRPTSPNPPGAATFAFSSNETGTFECRLDVGAWSACASPVSYTLPAGEHWFYVHAVDRAGNVGLEDYASWMQLGAPPNDAFASAQLLGAASGSVNGTTQYATKEAGEPRHAGNAGGHSVWYRWTAGATGTLTVTTAGSSFDTLLAVYTGSSVSALTAVASNDDVSKRDSTSRVSFTATSGQTYSIAIDGYAGASGSLTLNWSGPAPAVDTTPPDTSITAGPAGASPSGAPSFSFASTESGSTFECRLDGAAWTACTSPKAFTGVLDGSHTFEVRATDAAGNVDATPASRTWTVDTVAPDTSITSGPSGTVSSTSASFAFGSSESGTFTCRLDGGTWAACSSPQSYSSLAAGSHTFDVRATDAAGNVDPTPASRTWTVAPPPDTTPPDTTITSAPPATTTSTAASFSFTATEPGTFACALDGAAWTACTSPAAYTGLAVGTHTFQVRATDSAGNLDATPASATWTVQAAATSNDMFANAQVISAASGTATGTTVGMTKEAGEPNHAGNAGGHSIWFSWTAPAAGTATIDTIGSSFDTLLAVYTGTTVSALTAIASNDDASGVQSRVTFTAAAGTTYRIAVDGYAGASGSVTLDWSLASGGSSGPANDLFASAQVLSGASGSATGSTAGASKEAGEPAHAGNAGGHSIWFAWTAPSSGTASVSLAGSGFDTLLGVYTGGSVSALAAVASNDDSNGTLQSAVTFGAVAGTTYRIAVDGYGGATGAVKLAWSLP